MKDFKKLMSLPVLCIKYVVFATVRDAKSALLVMAMAQWRMAPTAIYVTVKAKSNAMYVTDMVTTMIK